MVRRKLERCLMVRSKLERCLMVRSVMVRCFMDRSKLVRCVMVRCKLDLTRPRCSMSPPQNNTGIARNRAAYRPKCNTAYSALRISGG